MSVPVQLRVSGAATLGPIQPTSSPFPSGQTAMSLNFSDTVLAHTGTRAIPINSPSPAFFDLMAGSGITSVRWVVIIPRSGSFVLRFTTSAGVDQLVDLSGLWAQRLPVPGTEITALAIQGVGDIEMQLAGDP